MPPRPLAMIASFPPPMTGQGLAARILCDGLKPEDFRIYQLNLSDSVRGDAAFWRILKCSGLAAQLFALCLREKDLIIYLQMGFGRASIFRDMLFLTLSRLFGKRLIVHVHGSGFRVAFDSLPRPVQAMEHHLLSGIEKAIVLSPSLAAMFRGLIADDRICAVPNGVSEDVLCAATAFARRPRPKDKPFRVLYLSNLLRMKGYETILRAALLAKRAGLDWHFDIAGPQIPGQGTDPEAYIQQHALDDFITWHGLALGDQKMALYKNADCFVLTSFFEGQPLCILEAMHFALPVIAKPVGGIPDIFSQDETGFVPLGHAPDVHGSRPSPKELDARIEQDAEALLPLLRALADAPERALDMGRHNQKLAMDIYTPAYHCTCMAAIFSDTPKSDGCPSL